MAESTRSPSTLRALSDDLAAAVERAAASVVAVHARPRIPASAILWREEVLVATTPPVRRDEEIPVSLPDGSRATASVAGRDPGPALVVLRVPPSLAATRPA